MRQDYAKNRRVAEALYEHTRGAATDSGFPVVEVNDDRQRGDTFGARLANAFADAFAQGYEQVIAVGSDCPTLHEVEWKDIAQRLAAGTPVLGPTPDREGTYLIGMTRAQFDRDAFAALPWKSTDLCSALRRHLAAQADRAPAFLAERDDVNGHQELLCLLRRRVPLPRRLVRRLRRILGGREGIPHRAKRSPGRCTIGHRSRAPPSGLRRRP